MLFAIVLWVVSKIAKRFQPLEVLGKHIGSTSGAGWHAEVSHDLILREHQTGTGLRMWTKGDRRSQVSRSAAVFLPCIQDPLCNMNVL